MLIKILKSALKFVLFITISLVVLLLITIKYPNNIIEFINDNTKYNISLDSVIPSFYQNNLKLNNLIIQDGLNTYSFNTIKINTNFDINIDDANFNIQNKGNQNNNLWQKIPNLDINNLVINYHNLNLNTKLNIKNNILNANIKKLIYNPIILKHIANKKVVNYIKQSVEELNAKDIKINFNFTNSKFNISGIIDNLIFNPYKDWQQIKSNNIAFNANNEIISFKIIDAEIDNLAIKDAKVLLDFTKKNNIEINIKNQYKTNEIINFLQNSPLKTKLSKALKHIKATGETKTYIYLKFYFDKAKDDIISITSQLKDNTIKLFDKLLINNFNGKLSFNKELNVIGKGSIRDNKFDLNLNYSKNKLNAKINNDSTLINIDKTESKIWLLKIFNNNFTAGIDLNFSNEIPEIYLKDALITNNNTNTNNNKINLSPNDLDDFKLKTNNIKLGNILLPNIVANIKKGNDKLNINNLIINDIVFNGFWQNNLTKLTSKIQNKSLQKLLDDLNIKQKVGGGKIDANLTLSCNCNPWQINMANLEGKLTAKIKKGIISNQNNFFAKLLAILSIKSLEKTLKVEKNNISGNDLKYDEINTNIRLKKGIATINDFLLQSNVVDIKLSGSTNFNTKTHNLNAEVMPHIKDSVPLIAYLTGGGPNGLALWLIDLIIFQEKLLSAITNSVAQIDYKITGPWDNPTIK